jgi:hypothetical protein
MKKETKVMSKPVTFISVNINPLFIKATVMMLETFQRLNEDAVIDEELTDEIAEWNRVLEYMATQEGTTKENKSC